MSIFKKKGTVESLFRMGEGAEGGKGSLHQTPLRVDKQSNGCVRSYHPKLLFTERAPLGRLRTRTKGWAARLPSWSHA